MNESEWKCPICQKKFKSKKSQNRTYCSRACKSIAFTSSLESFYQKVEKTKSCWIWIGTRLKSGYGQLRVGKRKRMRAHRFIWEKTFGQIPNGLCVCHKCDNPSCVNPIHLFLGTHQDNRDDCCAKGRQASGDRSGLRLHPERAPRGERNANSKIKAADVIEIRKQFSEGNTQQSIADRFGITQTNVSQIVLLNSWRHI